MATDMWPNCASAPLPISHFPLAHIPIQLSWVWQQLHNLNSATGTPHGTVTGMHDTYGILGDAVGHIWVR